MTTAMTANVLGGLLAALGILSAVAVGCGQDVATCATVSALPGGASFAETCASMQQSCTSGSGSADLRAYLTCVSNAGTVSATGPCEGLFVTVSGECLVGPSGTGSGTGTSTGSGAVGACATLGACCSDVPTVTVASCDAIAAAGVQSSCATTLAEIEAAGYCVGGSGTSSVHTSTTSVTSSVSGANCGVNQPCTPGEQCGLSGQGPCGSDVTLQCDTNGLFVVESFPCVGVQSCGFGTGTCSENCNCTDGEMACVGNCPDAGL